MKGIGAAVRCQYPALKLGKIVLKHSRAPGGEAVVEILLQEYGAWLIAGVLKISGAELGMRYFPTTQRWRREMKSRARRALEEVAQ